MLPIEELRAEYTAITHNRVVVTEGGYVPSREEARKLFKAERAMEVFKREYASGVYGLACTMDLTYVGVPLANPIIKENGKFRPNIVIDENKRKVRAKAAVLALADILTGRFGAASSRATPIMRTTELICAVSKQPIPNLIHGFYMDYAEESSKVLVASLKSGLVRDLKVFAYGEGPAKALSGEELSVDGPAPDGTLVTFAADAGAISARSVVSNGMATARIASDVATTAHISATTEGAGGAVQSTAVVTFTDCPVPLTGARIDGPVNVTGTLYIETLYTFEAVITPTDATPIITYTWSFNLDYFGS